MTVLFLSIHHDVGGRCFRGQAKKEGVGGVTRQAKAVYFPGQQVQRLQKALFSSQCKNQMWF